MYRKKGGAEKSQQTAEKPQQVEIIPYNEGGFTLTSLAYVADMKALFISSFDSLQILAQNCKPSLSPSQSLRKKPLVSFHYPAQTLLALAILIDNPYNPSNYPE